MKEHKPSPWLEELLGSDLVVWRLAVRREDIVFVRAVVEASDGLGVVLDERRGRGAVNGPAGQVLVAAPWSRARELEELFDDLEMELGARAERVGN